MEINRTEILNRFGKQPKINSERALYIQDIVLLTGRTFKSVLGQTKEMTPNEIREIYERAIKWKLNPPALCNKLLKEKRIEILRILVHKNDRT